MHSEEIIQAINGYKYVAFDMFDTLVLRNVCNPRDIFRFIEKELVSKGIIIDSFYQRRVEAEKKAVELRENEHQEITINQIYDTIFPNDHFLREQIKQIEKETEIKFCIANIDFEGVLKYCYENQITVLIISDMYLDKETIIQMLQKCRIKYDYLFLSSEVGLRKSRGSLFEYAINQLNIGRKDMIHVGDNRKSDYIIPKLHGIKSVHYNPIKYARVSNIQDSVISSLLINNGRFIKNGFEKAGYTSFGPLLFGFCQWIHERIIEKNYDQVLFLSRDGFIMQKAYSLLYPNDNSQYIYVSRRSLTVPQLMSVSNFKEIVDVIAYIKREETVETLLHKLGLEDITLCDDLVRKYGNIISRDKLVSGYYTGLYDEIIGMVKENAKRELCLINEYISQNISIGRVAIVDIGWYGTMQHNLQLLIKSLGKQISIDGYYLGYLGRKYDDISASGYIFDEINRSNVCNDNLLFGFNGLIETFFTASHGSVKKYQKEGDYVIPIFEQWEEENWDKVSLIHEGALRFVKDVIIQGCADVTWGAKKAWKNIGKLLINPNREELKLFSSFIFFDTYTEPLNKYRGIFKYILNPKLCCDDFMKSNWKLGFIKSMFKGIIRTEKIYIILNKLKK